MGSDPQRRRASVLMLLVFLGISGCRAVPPQVELGLLQYYEVLPRIPSVPVLEHAEPFESFVMFWGYASLPAGAGADSVPIRVTLEGRSFPVTSGRSRLVADRILYLGCLPDPQAHTRLPVDWGTGNLFATPPEQRKHVEIEVTFADMAGGTWNGRGSIEQSTVLVLDAVQELLDPSRADPPAPDWFQAQTLSAADIRLDAPAPQPGESGE